MRYNFIRVLIFISSIFIAAVESKAQWNSVGPGGGSDLEAIAVHPQNPDVVYIGGDIEGVFKTTDGGGSWKNVTANLNTEYSTGVNYIQEIIFDTFDNTYQTLYLCNAVGLFVTTNGGENWNRLYPMEIQTAEDYVPISYLSIDPANQNILFIGTGFSHSSDEGTGALFRSSNKGLSWEEIYTFPNHAVINGIFVDPQSPQNNRAIFVSTNEGFFNSNNNGVSWTLKNSGLPHNDIKRLTGVYHNNNLNLFLSINTHGNPAVPTSFQGGLYKSTNQGDSWISIKGNLPMFQNDGNLFYYYWKFSVVQTNPDIIYTATTRSMPVGGSAAYEQMGVYKTTNGGINWEYISGNINYGWLDDTFGNEKHAFVLEAAPSSPDIIYWGLVWMNKSADAGNTWNQIYTKKIGNGWQTTGLEFMAVEGMTFDPAADNIVYISYDDFGPFKSTDGGLSFFHLDQLQDPYDGYDAAKDLIVDPSNSNHLYLSRYEGLAGAYQSGFLLGQVWFSSNAGETWNKISNGLPDGRPELILDNNSASPGSRTLYCTIYHKGIYKSTNSGLNWSAINSGLSTHQTKVWSVCISPINSDVLYLGINNFGSGGGLYKSINAGSDWQKVFSFPDLDVMKIKIDSDGNIYVAATDNYDWNTSGGLYKSSDDGMTWIKILGYSRIADIEIDPMNNDKIYAVQQNWYVHPQTEPGVFVSNDAGLNWQSISANLPHRFIRFIKINPDTPNWVYVGTNGGGVFFKDIAVSVIESNEKIPSEFNLFQNYPNPFNPSTKIKYSLPFESKIKIVIYNSIGEQVFELLTSVENAGYHEANFNAGENASGIYFYFLTAVSVDGEETFHAVKKMLMIK